MHIAVSGRRTRAYIYAHHAQRVNYIGGKRCSILRTVELWEIPIQEYSVTHRRRNRGGHQGMCPPLVRICLLVLPLETVWYGDLFDHTPSWTEMDQESSSLRESASLGVKTSVCNRATIIKDKETNCDATWTCRYMQADMWL